MSRKTGSGRRFMIAKNLIMMLATLAAILVAIFAWFGSNNEAKASGISMKTKTPDKIELAVPEKVEIDGKLVDSFPLDNKSWTPELDFSLSGYLKKMVKDVTSDGKQFAVPNFAAANNLAEGRKVIADDVWVDGLSSKDALTNDKPNDDDQYHYVSLDFYVRSLQPNPVTITEDSYLAAGSEKGIKDDLTDGGKDSARLLKGSNVYRPSSYGASKSDDSFSADAIIGAMRVSLVGAQVDSVQTTSHDTIDSVTQEQVTRDVTTETTYNGGTWAKKAALKLLWLPRPDIYLQTDNNQDQWKLYTDIKPNSELASKTYIHSFYLGQTQTDGTASVKKGLTYTQYCDANVKTIDNTADHKGVYKVSKIDNNDKELGKTKGYYPTFGQQQEIASGSTPSQITFVESAANPTTAGYYVYKFTLNLWIEGEDAEARRSMNTGIFNLMLGFEA